MNWKTYRFHILTMPCVNLVYCFLDNEASGMTVPSTKLNPNLHSRKQTKLLLQINLIWELKNANNRIIPSCSIWAKQNKTKLLTFLTKKDTSCISVSKPGCFFACVIFIPRLNLTVVLSNHYAVSLSCSEVLPASVELDFYVGFGVFSIYLIQTTLGIHLKVFSEKFCFKILR